MGGPRDTSCPGETALALLLQPELLSDRFSDKTCSRFIWEQEVITILAGFHLSLTSSISLGAHSTPDCRQQTFPHPCSSIICHILHNIPPARAGRSSSCLATAWQHEDTLSDCFRLQVTWEAPRKALDSQCACRLVSVEGNSLCSRFEALALVFPTSQVLN